LSGTPIEVVVEPSRLRPADIEHLVADTSRFENDTGWRPHIPLEQTLADLLDWWRRVLATESA
jgi:GDP-4-dehydro-6-deoxy-D-mannose reductase